MNKRDPSSLMASIAAEIRNQRYPPVERWNPDFCGDIDMRIAADGRWYYMGTPITRQPMVRLFASVLRKDANGKTYLVTPVEKIGITVDDAHFLITLADRVDDAERGPAIKLTTQVGDQFWLDAEHPLRIDEDPASGEPRPYVRVRGRLTGLLARPVFYQLVDWAEARPDGGDMLVLEVQSCGLRHALGRLPEALI